MVEVDKSSSADASTGSIASVEQSVDPSGAPVFTITGELDISSAGSVRELILQVVSAGPRKVTFDLGGLQFMDSTGIALLVMVAEKVETVEIRNPQRIVRRVIELSGLTGTLQITS